MKKQATLAAAGALALSLALAGCGGGAKAPEAAASNAAAAFGFHDTGYPIVDKTLTLRFSGAKAPLAPDYSSMSLVKGWQTKTNIEVKWENLPDTVYSEKKSLILASGDLPDAFYNTGFSNAEIATYGTNGTLLPLETLIPKYMPKLNAIFEKRPDIKAVVTSSDGHIYTLPRVEELGLVQYTNMIMINKAWLDKVGLAVPKTLEEYHQALLAFKTKDPNGNGKADEVPLTFWAGSWCGDILDLYAAAGGAPDNEDHRILKDGKVTFSANTPEYKQAMTTMHTWYTEGLLDQEAFSQDDKAYLAKGKTSTPTVGSMVWWEIPEAVGPDRAKDYVLLPILTGVAGKPLASVQNHADLNRGAMALTKSNKYPEATLRWADELYDPAMSAQANWGPIDITLKPNAAGVLEQIPAKGNESEGERRQKVAPGGPFIVTADDFKTVVLPEPRAAARQEIIASMYKPFAANEQYPNVAMSNEELQEITTIETDIQALVKEKRAKWIVSGGVEAEWDAYTKQLTAIGLDRMMQIYQDAYNRYVKK